MKTPITDSADWINRYPEYHVGAARYVDSDLARRLETDRAALMAIAERAAALATHQDCDPDHHSLVIDAMAAISAARANFPTP